MYLLVENQFFKIYKNLNEKIFLYIKLKVVNKFMI